MIDRTSAALRETDRADAGRDDDAQVSGVVVRDSRFGHGEAKVREAETHRATLHDALEESFPASDPPAMTQPKPTTTSAEQPDPVAEPAVVLPSEEARQSERNIWNGTAKLILGFSLMLCVIAAVLLWSFWK